MSTNQFDILTRQMLAAGIPVSQRLTAKALMEFGMRRPGKDLWPSIDSIAERAGFSRSTVKRHLSALAEAGIIRIEDRSKQRKSNRYSFPAVVKELSRKRLENEPLSGGSRSGGNPEPLDSGSSGEPRVSMRDDAAQSASALGASASAAKAEDHYKEADVFEDTVLCRNESWRVTLSSMSNRADGIIDIDLWMHAESPEEAVDPDTEKWKQHAAVVAGLEKAADDGVIDTYEASPDIYVYLTHRAGDVADKNLALTRAMTVTQIMIEALTG